jgi:hypothetical protein
VRWTSAPRRRSWAGACRRRPRLLLRLPLLLLLLLLLLGASDATAGTRTPAPHPPRTRACPPFLARETRRAALRWVDAKSSLGDFKSSLGDF